MKQVFSIPRPKLPAAPTQMGNATLPTTSVGPDAR